jgi:hypothetical protein
MDFVYYCCVPFGLRSFLELAGRPSGCCPIHLWLAGVVEVSRPHSLALVCGRFDVKHPFSACLYWMMQSLCPHAVC